MPSTVIGAIEYNPDTQVLRVTFVSGLVYDFKKVPEEVYEAFRSSRTKGIYFNKQIRPNYEGERINVTR